MKLSFKIFLVSALALIAVSFSSCEKPPSVVLNPNLTTEVIGQYQGNYIVNYEANPQDDISSQISLVVTDVDNTTIRVDAQGGDSFECKVSGSINNLTLSGIKNATGVYTLANDISGNYFNGRLYYKVTGTSNGGAFSAEFTAI